MSEQSQPEAKPAGTPSPPGKDLQLEREPHESDMHLMQRFVDLHATPPDSESPIDLVPNWPNIRMGNPQAAASATPKPQMLQPPPPPPQTGGTAKNVQARPQPPQPQPPSRGGRRP